MKKVLTLSLSALLMGTGLQAQQSDFTIYNSDEVQAEPNHPTTTPLANIELDAVRTLKEVNQKGKADAYPWISEDGLRLYLTQTVDKRDQIVMASRTSKTASFGKPTPLALNKEGDENMSCWLSEDELQIYITQQYSTVLHTASRANKSEDFGPLSEIKLEGEELSYIAAANLTQDGSELLVYENSKHRRILHYKKKDNNTYQFHAELSVSGESWEADPGHLSSDGLTYACTRHNTPSLYIFTRNNLEEDFSFDHEVEIGANFHQISWNEDQLVLCHTDNNTWHTNDLYLAKNTVLDQEEVVVEEVIEVAEAEEEFMPQSNITIVNLHIFPNPAVDQLNLKFELPEATENVQAVIVDVQGRMVINQNINNVNSIAQLDVSRLEAGTYFVTLRGENMQTPPQTLVVK